MTGLRDPQPLSMNAKKCLACQLVTLSLLASAGAEGLALAQTARDTPGARADAAAGARDGAGHNAQPDCASLLDGRGKRVLIQRDGLAVGSSFSRDCPSDGKQSSSVEAQKPNVVDDKPKAADAVPGLSAGSVQVDEPVAGEQGEGGSLAVRVTPGRLSASVLTGGTAIWLLQSGFWTSLLILGLPIWRHVDLLPIVDAASDDESARGAAPPDAGEERAVARVLEAQAPQRTGAAERR
jgi:hypothetical protein